MKVIYASITIELDKRRVKKKTGKFPIKLLVVYQGEPQRYQTIFDLTKEEFDKLKSASRINDQRKDIREKFRTLFNEAIEQGLIRRDKHYPFGRRKYVPPASRNIKKALTLQDVSKLYYFQPICEQVQWAKDFWFFSYLANGINTKDIVLLKYRNIHGEYLVFERAKTEKSTCNDPKPISVFISGDLHLIINRWGNKDRDPDNYIFPILISGITPM